VWSRCHGCDQVAIWEGGALTFPSPAEDTVPIRLPLTARAALLVTAYQGREEAFARLAGARDALAAAERETHATLQFLALFTRYDVEALSAPQTPLSIAS
jgi:hypothetical protein